jgi:exodeoxyribonuclease VII small subunit
MAEPNFEKDLENLEKIVEALEEGDLTLDDALKRFEEGIRLAQRCEKALSAAEQRIEILTRNADGGLDAQPFDEDAAEEPAEAPAKEAPAKPRAKAAPKPEPEFAAGEEDHEEAEDDGNLLF